MMCKAQNPHGTVPFVLCQAGVNTTFPCGCSRSYGGNRLTAFIKLFKKAYVLFVPIKMEMMLGILQTAAHDPLHWDDLEGLLKLLIELRERAVCVMGQAFQIEVNGIVAVHEGDEDYNFYQPNVRNLKRFLTIHIPYLRKRFMEQAVRQQ